MIDTFLDTLEASAIFRVIAVVVITVPIVTLIDCFVKLSTGN